MVTPFYAERQAKMRLSANLIRTYNNINSFGFGDWSVRANEPNTLYFQIVDLDQMPWVVRQNTSWPGIVQITDDHNSLRYLTGQNGNTPVVVTVTFPSMDCNSSALVVTATAVDAADASLFKVDLTALQVPGSGNVIFSVQEGAVTRKFLVMDAISVENVLSPGQC